MSKRDSSVVCSRTRGAKDIADALRDIMLRYNADVKAHRIDDGTEINI